MTPDVLLAAADRCVKCGLCLPHCPTYGLFRDESESPRGRIALIQGLTEGRLEVSPRLLGHLDRCLLCRNCETACPSGVRYGLIMDEARARLHERAPADWMVDLVTDRRRLARLARLLTPVERSGILGMVPARWRRMAGWVLRARRPRTGRAAPAEGEPGARRGTVVLFEGCVSGEVDGAAVAAARRLLAHLGYRVVPAPLDLCCGAIHRHAGRAGEASARLAHVREWLAGQAVDAVLSVASGCGAELLERGGFSMPVYDVGAFLAGVEWPQALISAMPPHRLLLHQPCTLRNGMGQHGAVADLLRRFDGLEVTVLDSGCCGGAGMHLVSHPELATRIAAPLVARARESGAGVLLTSNTGCRLHLADECRAAGLTLSVRHPVEFIAEQLGI